VNAEKFARSIGLIAPVSQDPGFEHANEIEEMLTLYIPAHYRPIEIFLNGMPVYRPFVKGLSKPKEIQVIDDNGDLLAYGWACLNTASEPHKRQIIEDDLRGVALMQRGIAIGSRSLPEDMCVIRAMPTGDSDGCRPPVPGHADHVFQSHGVHFSGTPESVDDMCWIAWTPCSGILGRT
jgi:hypothetical protein